MTDIDFDLVILERGDRLFTLTDMAQMATDVAEMGLTINAIGIMTPEGGTPMLSFHCQLEPELVTRKTTKKFNDLKKHMAAQVRH